MSGPRSGAAIKDGETVGQLRDRLCQWRGEDIELAAVSKTRFDLGRDRPWSRLQMGILGKRCVQILTTRCRRLRRDNVVLLNRHPLARVQAAVVGSPTILRNLAGYRRWGLRSKSWLRNWSARRRSAQARSSGRRDVLTQLGRPTPRGSGVPLALAQVAQILRGPLIFRFRNAASLLGGETYCPSVASRHHRKIRPPSPTPCRRGGQRAPRGASHALRALRITQILMRQCVRCLMLCWFVVGHPWLTHASMQLAPGFVPIPAALAELSDRGLYILYRVVSSARYDGVLADDVRRDASFYAVARSLVSRYHRMCG